VITVTGRAIVPGNAGAIDGALLRVEVRDAAVADAPSVLLAARSWPGVSTGPGQELPFTVEVADVPAGAVLTLRVHVDRTGDGIVRAGDLLSTQFQPIPSTGTPTSIVVPLTVIE
jgi:putative lipoprotein